MKPWRIVPMGNVRPFAAVLALAMAGVQGACATSTTVGSTSALPHPPGPANGLATPDRQPDCARLRTDVARQLELMLNAANTAKAQAATAPNTVVKAFSRMFGAGHGGIPAIEDYEREKRKAENLNAAVATQGCQPVDLEKEGEPSRKIIEGLKGNL